MDIRQLDFNDGNVWMKPKTVVFETRCDIRSLAMIARYLHSIGIPCTTKSALGTAIIEAFADRLLEKGHARPASSEDAQSLLHSLGVSLTQRERRALVALQEQLDIEDALAPTADTEKAKRIARELLE